MSGDDDGGDVLTLVTNRPAVRRDEETIAPGDTYATVKGPRTAIALKFIRRDGRSFAVPYAYLPIIWCEAPDTILIEYPSLFTVALLGDGNSLEGLEDLIADHKLTRIRACEPHIAAALPVAVTRIEIIRSYPSRELADRPPAGEP